MGWYRDASGKPVWVADNAAPAVVPVGPRNPKPAADMANDQQRLAMEAERLRIAQQQASLENQIKQMQIDEANKKAMAGDPRNDPAMMAEMRLDAGNRLRDIRTIRANTEQPGAVGSLLTPLLSRVPGTAARTVQANVDTVSQGGALQKIMEMTRATGKNPFTPMSNSDVALIALTQGNLDPSLARDEFGRQLGKFEGANRRAFLAAGGNLTDVYPREYLNSGRAEGEKALRRMIRGYTPEQARRAWQRFNEIMGPPPAGNPAKAARGKPKPKASTGVIDFNDLP